MAKFDYEMFSDDRWVFNANKYTKEQAKEIYIKEAKDYVFPEDLKILRAPTPIKCYARHFIRSEDESYLDYPDGVVKITATAKTRPKEQGEFEVWVMLSYDEVLDGK